MSTVAHPGHPMGPSIPADSSLTPLSWEGDKMFNIYIYDYCSKRGFKRTAKELLAEAEIPSESTPPINARQGLLFEWWSVFWVLFTAKANGHGPDDAMIYTQHQANQAANRQRQPPPQPGQPILQNGGQIPIGGQMRPPGLMNGLPVPGGPRNYIPNGVGPAPGFGNPQINGAPTPGPGPGYQNLMPGQRPPQRNGNIGPGPPFENHNPNSNSMPNSSQNPNNPNPNQPGPGPGPGQSPHMRAMGMGGMIPPGQNNQSGAGGYQQLGRPPSRTATPGAMMTQQSPRPTPMIDPQNLNAEITKIPQQVLGQLKQELGLESKDLPSLTMDDKQRILQTFRNRQQQRTKLPGQPNAAAGPSNMMAGQQQPQQRNTRPSKRNSTSPGDEDMNQGNGSSPPATKRIRRSPLEQPPMTPMAAGYPQMPPQQPMMGIPRGPPPNGFSIPQGMQMVNPMSVQMGNNMTMAGMSPGMSNNPGGMMTPQMQVCKTSRTTPSIIDKRWLCIIINVARPWVRDL
ncbi:hypothetical protein C8J56DRAFT_245729 [Mycena floridula]|nr:hypothetical protein C8J56DRAFT_245729 [Mycena floridula]